LVVHGVVCMVLDGVIVGRCESVLIVVAIVFVAKCREGCVW
jgi:hypothetical protein